MSSIYDVTNLRGFTAMVFFYMDFNIDTWFLIFETIYLDRGSRYGNTTSQGGKPFLGEQVCGTNSLYYLSYFSSYRASKSVNAVNLSYKWHFETI